MDYDGPTTSSYYADEDYGGGGGGRGNDTWVAMENPIVRLAGSIAAIIYIATFVVGIPANLYVLFRMRRLASSDNERYRNGTGIALCSMAAADLCSILLICAQNVHTMTYDGTHEPAVYTVAAHAMCKGMLFLTHTVTSISIWSWLLLSSLRYLAICHPLYHLRLWRMPYRALAFIISLSALLNAWLLVAVHSTPEGCIQVSLLRNSLGANRLLHIVEAIWSFVIPCIVIIIMDTSVVLKSTTLPRFRLRRVPRKASAMEEVIKLTRTSSDKLKRRHQKALFKWLAVALVCILLNTPENMYRLILLFYPGLGSGMDDPISLGCRILAQTLYFSQFAFNAIYLAIFVYDKSCRGTRGAGGGTGGAHETSIINSHAARSRRPSHEPMLNGSLKGDAIRKSASIANGSYNSAMNGDIIRKSQSITNGGAFAKPTHLRLIPSAPRLLMPSTQIGSTISTPPTAAETISLPATPRPMLLKVFPKDLKISSAMSTPGEMPLITRIC